MGTAARNTEGKGLMCAAGAVEHPALTSPEIAVRGQGEWALTPVDSRPVGERDRGRLHSAPGGQPGGPEQQQAPLPGEGQGRGSSKPS